MCVLKHYYHRNQKKWNLYYPRIITQKRVTSGQVHLRVIAPEDNKISFEEMSEQWQAVGNTASDLTDLKFEPQTTCSWVEHIIARPLKHHSNPVQYFSGKNGKILGDSSCSI